MKILFLGGNGNISWWCVQKALEKGFDVYELNRAATRETRRDIQADVHQITADINDCESVTDAMEGVTFDVICDFICFNAEQARERIGLFSGRTSQYIVISSEAVYERKSEFLPFSEDTPQYSPEVDDAYISGKVMMEKTFGKAYKQGGFPLTIVRPGYTYDTIIQVPLGLNCFTVPQRLSEGYPLIMLGEGENLIAPLHSSDFADAFVGLIGNQNAIGQDFHIAAEKVITWNEMGAAILKSLGQKQNNIMHIPRDKAVKITDFCSNVVNRQHMWHYLFDDKKIKTVVPDWNQKIYFWEGIEMTVEWLLEDRRHQRINKEYDKKLMRLYKQYKECWEDELSFMPQQ